MKWIALVLVAAALAGCTSQTADGSADLTPDHRDVTGTVVTPQVMPVAGAIVVASVDGIQTTTNASGGFKLHDVPLEAFNLTISADGFENKTLAVPAIPFVDGAYTERLGRIDLVPLPAATPPPITIPFQGHWQCSLEAFIITPSCDSIITHLREEEGVPVDDVFSTESEFLFAVEDDWANIVVDVKFDATSHPGIAGLRAQLGAPEDPDALTEYEKYGDFTGAQTFTFMVEPGADYGGDRPMLRGAGDIHLEVYPLSHGWHATCDATCLLGVAAGVDIQFDLFVTIFYEPAPAGWSFLA